MKLGLVGVAACAFWTLGCKHDPSLVGKWAGAISGFDATLEFKEDKTVSLELKKGDQSATFGGTYELSEKGHDLTIKLKKAAVKNVPGPPSNADAFTKPFEGRELKESYNFNTDDELALTLAKTTDVLKRVKESSSGS